MGDPLSEYEKMIKDALIREEIKNLGNREREAKQKALQRANEILDQDVLPQAREGKYLSYKELEDLINERQRNLEGKENVIISPQTVVDTLTKRSFSEFQKSLKKEANEVALLSRVHDHLNRTKPTSTRQ